MARATASNASVTDALFLPLDQATQDRFRIGTDPEPTQEERLRAEKKAEKKADPSAIENQKPRANPPKTPWQFNKSDWMAVGKRTIKEIGEDRVSSVAGGVTFFVLLALFPAMTALVSLYGLFADRAAITRHLDLLNEFLPPGAVEIISDQVVAIASAPGTALSFAGIFALLMAFYSANGGTKAVLDGLNVAYFRTESRGFIWLNLVAMGFTIAGMLVAIALISVIAVIPTLLRWFPLPGGTEWAVVILRWPLMFAVVALSLAALYRWGPDKPDGKWEWLSPGALFATVGLGVASMLFSWYATNLTDFNETYGSLGAVIALMMWMWIASMVVLIGAEINSEVERQLKAVNGEKTAAAEAEVKAQSGEAHRPPR